MTDTRGILIKNWQHLPSVITPSMTEGGRGWRVDPLVPIPASLYSRPRILITHQEQQYPDTERERERQRERERAENTFWGNLR